jgi:hypothetical protein
MVAGFDFTDMFLTPAKNMTVAIIYSLNYHIGIARGINGLTRLFVVLTATEVDVKTNPNMDTLTTTGMDGVGAIAMESAETSIADTRKVVLGVTFPSLSSTTPF